MAQKKKTRISAKQRKEARGEDPYTPTQRNKMCRLALSGCQNLTIARIMGINEDTMLRHHKELLQQKRAERKYNLRKQQNLVAKKGNPAMNIFLGKNELGQADKQDIAMSGEVRLLPPIIKRPRVK